MKDLNVELTIALIAYRMAVKRNATSNIQDYLVMHLESTYQTFIQQLQSPSPLFFNH